MESIFHHFERTFIEANKTFLFEGWGSNFNQDKINKIYKILDI